MQNLGHFYFFGVTVSLMLIIILLQWKLMKIFKLLTLKGLNEKLRDAKLRIQSRTDTLLPTLCFTYPFNLSGLWKPLTHYAGTVLD